MATFPKQLYNNEELGKVVRFQLYFSYLLSNPSSAVWTTHHILKDLPAQKQWLVQMILLAQSEYYQLKYYLIPSKIFAVSNSTFYKTVRVTKILGIKFFTDKSEINLLDLIKTQIAKYTRFISRAKTLKAKKQTTETFILPNFLYYSRHTETTLNNLTNVQRLTNNLLKTGDKMEIRSEVHYQSVAMGGISLPHITSKIISAKLIDEINSSDENEISFSKDLTILLKSLKLKTSQTENSILL